MSQEKKNIRIQQRVDTKENWLNIDAELLLEDELGFEKETGQFKIGDGIHMWEDLPYAGIGRSTEQGGEVFNDYENNIATGKASHAEGQGTVAKDEASHVQGRYNVYDTEKLYAHIIGNGTSDTNRSNAHTLDWDGNAYFSGNIDTNTFETVKFFINNGDKTEFNNWLNNVSNISKNYMINLQAMDGQSHSETYLLFHNSYLEASGYTNQVLISPYFPFEIKERLVTTRPFINSWITTNRKPYVYNFATLGKAFRDSDKFIKGDKIKINNINIGDYKILCNKEDDTELKDIIEIERRLCYNRIKKRIKEALADESIERSFQGN